MWYGERLQHWKSKRIKNIFALIDVRNFKPLSEVRLLTLYTAYGVRPHDEIEKTTGNRAVTADNYKIVRANDIIVNIILCWQGAIGLSKHDGVTSPAYDVYRAKSKKINVGYYNYLFRLPSFSGECYKAGRGIMAMRWRTYSDQFTTIEVPIPPREEQDQIVRYLDWKVSQINKLINAKRRQIGLLQEKKYALVSKTVTNVSNKVTRGRVGRFYNVTLGKMLQPNKKRDGDIYANYMCAANIKWSGIKLSPLKQMWFSESELAQYLVIEGDLLVTEGGDVGVSALWNNELDECYVQNSVHLVRSKENSSKYLYYWLLHLKMTGWIDNACNKATIAHFTKDKLENAPLLLPALDGQLTIALQLDEQCIKIDDIVAKLSEELTLLNEYRIRLISDVVTGKKNVHGIAVPQYETAEITTETVETEAEEHDESNQ